MKNSEKLELMAKIIPPLFDGPTKLKRDHLHKSVCNTLKISKSVNNIYLIKNVLKALGVRETVIMGELIYSTYPPGRYPEK
jgi:hypothetical protein